MEEPTWVLRESVLALPEELLAQFGGSAGLRDANMLDSALVRPKHLAEADAVVRTLALAAGERFEAGYAAWLKANSKRAGTARRDLALRCILTPRAAGGYSFRPISDEAR